MNGYGVSRLEEIPIRETWIPIREHFGITAFGVNAFRQAEAGKPVISEHTEITVDHEELYVVVDGHAVFTVDGEDLDAPAGTLVFVSDPKAQRAAVAREPGTTVLAVGAKPGEAFSVSSWEETWQENREAMALYREQRYEEAANLLTRAIEQHPDAAGLHYNLACFESMAGAEPAAVVGHLTRAIELYPGFREFARSDGDFDPVRETPEFRALVEDAR